jgi:hypothetical protein
VAWARQPLEVLERVIVAGHDVVTFGTDAVTASGVLDGFTATAGAAFGLGSELRPVGG